MIQTRRSLNSAEVNKVHKFVIELKENDREYRQYRQGYVSTESFNGPDK